MDKNISLEWLNPETLKPNPMNWRTHPERQKKVLDAVLSEVGWAGVALYNKRTGHLIDGHARRDWAIKNGVEMPVLVGEWEEKDEKKILATLDPIAAMAEQADEALMQLMEGIETQNGDLSEWADAVLGKLKGEIDDPNAEWAGMPEYGNTPKAEISIHFHFETARDRDETFAKLGIPIPTVNYQWIPPREKNNPGEYRYESE
jgi:hypothetical protein